MNKQNISAIAKEALKTPPKKKAVTLEKEPAILADGSVMTPLKVKSNSDALTASLLMLFKHVADVHVTLVEIVSEKFNLNQEDVINAIREDLRWEKALQEPLVTELTATAKANSVSKPKRIIKVSDEPEIVFD